MSQHAVGKAENQGASTWWGACRLLACLTNIFMIIGMYLEYLWAADWPELPAHCEYRSTLAWLDLADCFHRNPTPLQKGYTFSHAMLRGQNLTIFAFVGALVVACLTMVEHQRVRRLTSLLKLHAVKASGAEDPAQQCLKYLSVYSRLMDLAFPGVLLLVPFNLERPVMHYGCTLLVVSAMVGGVVAYATMPLAAAAGLSDQEEPTNELHDWAKRHQSLKWKAGVIIALHFVLPATAAVHHFAWLDATGRLFGLCEVSAILSYQIFLATFVAYDFAASKFAPMPSPTRKAVIPCHCIGGSSAQYK